MEMKGPETTHKQMSYLTRCIQLDPFVLYPPYKQTWLHSWGTGAMKPVLNAKTLEYGKCTLVYEAVSYVANTSALPTPLKSRRQTLISGGEYGYTLVPVPLLPKSPKSLPRRHRQRLTPFLPFLSAPPFHHRTGEEEHNKDLFLPKAASCTASFLPATFHLSWHNHPMTGLKVIQFPSDILVGNHPPFKVPKKTK